ncbi:T9SS type A sorting domain-containing protein [Daejeonella sp.]|uniref:T9SS type A sorting domain-containing protein n=1 Tax=Daejeonella sp. TaxID=2805397 RepID=UPI0030BA90B1
MKKKLPKIVLLLLTVVYSAVSGQTVIDYEDFNSSACNAFSSTTNVGGIPHRTVKGQPQKMTGALNLRADYDIATPRGTEYAITYAFKQAYSYKITISVIRANPTGNAGAIIRLRTDLANTIGVNTLCSGPQSIDPSASGNLKQSEQMPSTAWSQTPNTLVFNYTNLAAAQSYLLIAAIPPLNASPQTLLIRKILIEEVGSADLELSPASLTTACGTAVTQTFSVANPNGVANITGYDWDLGNSSNGWTYNGSPAPQFISTGSPSLTLTSSCTGAGLQNVKVTVKVNNAAYKTYTSIVSAGPVSFNISGDNTICSGTVTYTPDNIPCNSTVSWSVSGTLAIAGTSGNSVDVYGTGEGAGILTATISGGCSGVMNKSIQTGYPIAPYFIDIFDPSSQPEYLCPNTTYRAEASWSGASYFEFHWSLPTDWTSPNGTGSAFTTSGLQAMITFTTGSIPTTSPFTVRGVNACGIGDGYTIYVSTENCSMLRYSIYPNPAADEIRVSSSAKSVPNTKDYEIRLYNEGGKVLKSLRSNPKVSETRMNTQDIPNGTYFLHIIEGKEVTKKQIIINH